MAVFRKLRQQSRPAAPPPETKRSNSSLSQSTTAVPPRRRRLLLDYAKSGLKQIRLARGSPKPKSRAAVDGDVLAWQERANVAVAREQQQERLSKDMEQAAAVLTRMAIVEEARVCWWIRDGA